MSNVKWQLKIAELEFYIAKRYCTKREFSKQIGISPSYLSQWLSELRTPRAEYRKKILEAFPGRGITYETFFKCYETTQSTLIDSRNRQ